ncbi:hypothetical protein [Amantichitinum ursilacus]|uniref:SRPBCC family protein n=1 Tax=Amantichitinum ursilacus TaxID=857265 RepID=A0A0N0XIN2_9NEIS|nr:hypothetical protein [Amantichitinum ursilacus]KPC52908.1 hypothetical protein WG78_10475 [Amantichitinum ursilacus]
MRLARFGVAVTMAATLSATWAAGTLVVPKQIEFDGKTYTVDFEKAMPQQAIHEYTTDGEKASTWDWTRLLTINQLDVGKGTLAQWAEVTRINLQRQKPTPFLMFDVQKDEAWVRIVYPPEKAHPTYEANSWHARLVDGCGMMVVQFARQIAAPDGKSDEALFAQAKAATERDLGLLKGLAVGASCQ